MLQIEMPQERFKESLDAYVKTRRPTGGFLRAVLENNLSEAMDRGDDEALADLPKIHKYIYNDLPSPCWGSPEKVTAWLKGES